MKNRKGEMKKWVMRVFLYVAAVKIYVRVLEQGRNRQCKPLCRIFKQTSKVGIVAAIPTTLCCNLVVL